MVAGQHDTHGRGIAQTAVRAVRGKTFITSVSPHLSRQVVEVGKGMPIRISSGFNCMSCSMTLPSVDKVRYLSMMPGSFSVPVISSVVSRSSRTSPPSLTILSNCPTDSMKRSIVSLSCISFGTRNFRHSVFQLLCCRERSLVVLVRNR